MLGVAMGTNYKQLSLEEQCKISLLREEGKAVRQIAVALARLLPLTSPLRCCLVAVDPTATWPLVFFTLTVPVPMKGKNALIIVNFS